jgi:ketosteroid isomerase-like protein
MSAEDDINALLTRYVRAIHDKDPAAVARCYTKDVVAYDLAPPLEFDSRAAVTDPAVLEQWFASWDGPIGSAATHLHIRAGGDVGYAFALRHMTGRKKSGEAVDMWFRATATVAKENGDWKITHIHNSVPFAMDGSGRAELNLKP